LQVSEAKCESVFDETISQIKQKEETMPSVNIPSKWRWNRAKNCEKDVFQPKETNRPSWKDNYTPSRGNGQHWNLPKQVQY
jgi:hypothetical protein